MTLLALALCAAQTQSPLSAVERRHFREIVTAVLAEPDPKKRELAIEKAAPLEDRAPIAEFVALVREGPIIADAEPKARAVTGQEEKLEKFGNVLSGLSFVHDGRVLRYCVDVPRSYDAKKRTGLLLDPGHGTGAKSDAKGKAGFLAMYRRHADAAGLQDWLIARTEIVEQIGSDGLVGERPDDEVAAAFDAFFRDISSRFAIDCDRVVVNGLSQTGYWSWYLARTNPRRFQAILPMSAVTWQVDPYASNFLDVTIAILHGGEDPTCAVGEPRATFALLRRLGARSVQYLEVADGKHDYAVWGEEPALLESVTAKPRARYPSAVSFSAQTTLQPWCGPVKIDELERTGNGAAGTKPTGGVDVAIEGQRITLRSDGVLGLTLAVSSEEIDVTKPVVLRWNGKPRAEAANLKPSLRAMLRVVGETVDWSATRDCVLQMRSP